MSDTNEQVQTKQQKSLSSRLDKILPKIESEDFLKNQGLGNEIGFYVFDYPPESELEVREHINFMTDKLVKRGRNFASINLFEAIIELLDSRNLTERAFKVQKEFILIHGLGSAWPIIRGHGLLNALHAKVGNIPTVLFYPGEYDGTALKPFGRIESNNYYRAFKLVP